MAPIVPGIMMMLASTIVSAALRPKPPGGKTGALPVPEPPAELGDEGKVAAAKLAEQRRRQAQRGGRASTIMTGPLGVTGSGPSGNKILTGG